MQTILSLMAHNIKNILYLENNKKEEYYEKRNLAIRKSKTVRNQ